MKQPYIELITETLFGTLAQFNNTQLPNHVSRGLTRHRNVTLDRFYAVILSVRRILEKIVDGLFTAPTLVMYTCIHHQSRRAP